MNSRNCAHSIGLIVVFRPSSDHINWTATATSREAASLLVTNLIVFFGSFAWARNPLARSAAQPLDLRPEIGRPGGVAHAQLASLAAVADASGDFEAPALLPRRGRRVGTSRLPRRGCRRSSDHRAYELLLGDADAGSRTLRPRAGGREGLAKTPSLHACSALRPRLLVMAANRFDKLAATLD